MEKLNFRVYPYFTHDDVEKNVSPQEADWQLDENGVPFIAGYYDVNDLIQQYEPEVDINNIIARHMATGTLEDLAVNAENDSIVDVSNIPSDINSQNAMAKNAYNIYNSFNDEQKALFTGYDDFLINFDRLFKQPTTTDDNGGNSNE